MKNTILILLALLSTLVTISAQSDLVNSINDNITQAKIKGHLTYIASDALRGRDTGSPGQAAAAAYIASRFVTYGVDTISGLGDYMQSVPMTLSIPPSRGTMQVGDVTLNFPDDFLVLNGDNNKNLLPMLYVQNAGTDEGWEGVDARMQIATTTAGDESSSDVGHWIRLASTKREKAIAAGAQGLIEIYQNSTVPWSMLKRMGTRKQIRVDEEQGSKNEKFSHIWLSTADSTVLEAVRNGTQSIKIDMEGINRQPIKTANVVGWVEGTDPELRDEYIVYGAHYDHIGVGRADAKGDTIYNGARDNAVGTAAVLSLAEYIGKYPTKRSSIFILFTGEEKGLLGSKWFVDHSPVPLDQIKYCYNIDNGGYNDTTIISVVGLTRTSAESLIQQSCQDYGVTAIEDAAGEQGLFDRSDNVNFAKKGIPAPTFSLGFTAFDDEIFKYYHQPGDEVESLNMNYVEKYVKSYILSAVRIGNADKAPEWNEGDKYYEAGQKLYGKK